MFKIEKLKYNLGLLYTIFLDSFLFLKNFKPDKLPEDINIYQKHSEYAVIMCSYKRVYRIRETLYNCLNQGINLDIYIWNNNQKEIKNIRKIISEYNKNNNINVFNSDKNIGGFGRFYFAKQIIPLQYKKYIFIDDDQDISNNFIKNIIDESDDLNVKSYWAFKFIPDNNKKYNYWVRKSLSPNEEADYGGTGGMIINPNIFKENKIFECPKRFWFIEDLWLSYIIKSELGLKIYKSKSVCKEYEEEFINNQSNSRYVKYKKIIFLNYLCKKGFLK